jgi:hypothetical protein
VFLNLYGNRDKDNKLYLKPEAWKSKHIVVPIKVDSFSILCKCYNQKSKSSKSGDAWA